MSNLYEGQKEEMLDVANEMIEKMGEIAGLYEELVRLGHEDYKIGQELEQGYVGDTLRNLIEELPEEIENRLAEQGE